MKSLVEVFEGFYQNVSSIYCEPAQQRDFLSSSAIFRKLYIFPTLIDSDILNNIAETIYKLGLKADKKRDWRIAFISSSNKPRSYISQFTFKRAQEIFTELTKKGLCTKEIEELKKLGAFVENHPSIANKEALCSTMELLFTLVALRFDRHIENFPELTVQNIFVIAKCGSRQDIDYLYATYNFHKFIEYDYRNDWFRLVLQRE